MIRSIWGEPVNARTLKGVPNPDLTPRTEESLRASRRFLVPDVLLKIQGHWVEAAYLVPA